MTIVVDASVAVKWVVPEPGSEAAGALHGDELIAPSLWLVEAANALWRLVLQGELIAEQASARLVELASAPVTSLPIEPHLRVALQLGIELHHPIYDCLYLAVALHHDTQVVTADRCFVAAVGNSPHADRVRLLGRG